MGECTWSDCGMMSGQKFLRGRRLCMVYSLARYVSRRLATAVRLIRWRLLRICDCLLGGCFEDIVGVGLFCVLSSGVGEGKVVCCM